MTFLSFCQNGTIMRDATVFEKSLVSNRWNSMDRLVLLLEPKILFN